MDQPPLVLGGDDEYEDIFNPKLPPPEKPARDTWFREKFVERVTAIEEEVGSLLAMDYSQTEAKKALLRYCRKRIADLHLWTNAMRDQITMRHYRIALKEVRVLVKQVDEASRISPKFTFRSKRQAGPTAENSKPFVFREKDLPVTKELDEWELDKVITIYDQRIEIKLAEEKEMKEREEEEEEEEEAEEDKGKVAEVVESQPKSILKKTDPLEKKQPKSILKKAKEPAAEMKMEPVFAAKKAPLILIKKREPIPLSRFKNFTFTGAYNSIIRARGPYPWDTPPLASLTLADLQGCVVAPVFVSGAAHISRARNCTFFVDCHQFRLHECEDIIVYLQCEAKPIIESVKGLQVTPLRLDYNGENHYKEVDDFNWLKDEPSPNWKVLGQYDRVKEPFITEMKRRCDEPWPPYIMRTVLSEVLPQKLEPLFSGRAPKAARN
ncbi:MAG: hypothetical protein M1814_001347 [Vezdaea aestivalis]|nr:MAG: hypothetical protein M1814_001347 [Vezdaea aestivalis]